MEKQGVIYKIENTVNGKMYFGQTRVGFEKRIKQHLYELRRNKHYNGFLQNAFNKYGEQAFKFEIAERCSVEELNTAEEFWIDLYDTMNSELGYNLASGGGVGTVMHESTRLKLGEINSKRNMNGRQVLCVDDGRKFESVKAASDFYGIDKTSISNVCLNNRNSAGGKRFVYVRTLADGREKIVQKGVREKSNRSGVVDLFDMKHYKTTTEAAKVFGVTRCAISNVCKGERLHVNGHKFVYANDELANCTDYVGVDLRTQKRVKDTRVVCVNEGTVFESAAAAARHYGVTRAFVSNICKGARKSKDGLIFKHYDDHTSI